MPVCPVIEMKKLFRPLPCCPEFVKSLLLIVCLLLGLANARATSPDLVIAETYSGAATAGATYNQKFIILFNRSATAKNIQNYTLQYASAAGTSWATVWTGANVSVPAYSYYLIGGATSSTAGAVPLPLTPDANPANWSGSATAGKMVLCSSTTSVGTGTNDPTTAANYVDFLGYGTTANAAEGGSTHHSGAPSAVNAAIRNSGGCTDTDFNDSDFTIAAVSGTVKNSSSTPNVCGAGSGPVITFNPQNTTVNDGGTTNFIVTATGTAPLYYQWLKNGATFTAFSTNSVVSFAPAALTDAGTYSVIVSNSVSTATSTTATLTVNPVGPTITGQPANAVGSAGTNVTFTVTATGSAPLAYQWLMNTTNIPSATNSSLTLSNIASTNIGSYACVVTNSVNSVTSSVATLTIAANTFTIMQYNVDGNSITGTDPTNWAATAPQVLAIGREVIYLNPDIIMFNEIPTAYKTQMTNWACLTNYPYQGTNAAGDGFIQNYVASKFPIVSTASHLHGSSLALFGYTNTSTFTRDLYEVEIAVPGLSSTLHVFQAHLKATTTSPQDDANKRAAEAAAVSNYFVTVFLPSAAGSHPYTLSGDMNEDAFFPETNNYNSGHPLQSMTAAATGLQMTDPVNPYTSSDYTESIRSPLDTRFDYILPCPSLYSNILSSQVFRTDKVSPLPGGLNANDDSIASDHLPVLMTFGVPSASAPFLGTDVASRTNLAGTTATFSVVAGGGTPLSYQWFNGTTALTDGGKISGSSSATLSITNVLAADAGSYSVTVTNSLGSTNSSTAVLTVIDPGLTTQPTNQTIFLGASAVFNVSATGTGTLSYQWSKGATVLSNGGDLVGTTTTSLTVTNAASSDAGTYTVATFNVVVSGTSPIYQWYRNGTALSNVGNILGSTTATLSVTNVLTADVASYSVVISNAANVVTSSVATLTVIDPAFTLQPKDSSTLSGGSVTFTATAAGTAPITYLWKRNGSNLSDGGNITGSASSALTVNPVGTGDVAQYSVVASGVGSATSTSAALSVTNVSGEVYQTTASYSQNFDGIGTTSSATLPAGWFMSATNGTPPASAPTFQGSGNFNFVTQAASSGSPTAGGRYNWGNGTNTSDRAVGFMTSGSYASPNSLMAGFYNGTGSTIAGLSFTFDYERFRTNSAAAAVTFFTSTDGTNWTAQTGGDSGAFATGTSAYSFTGGTVVSKSFTVSGLSIATGTTYYVRWNFNTTGANSQGLGLDNFTLTASNAVVTLTAPRLTATLAAGSLNLTWPTNGADGFALQTITNINTPAWLSAGSPAVSGTNYLMTVQATNNFNLYRLKK